MNRNMDLYIKQMIGQSKDIDIVYHCKQFYLQRMEKRKNKVINPNLMLKMFYKLTKLLNIPGREMTKIKTKIKNLIFDIRIQGSLKTKMAPIFHPSHLIHLITKLWYHRRNSNSKLLLAKRQAAMQAMICLVTGRRWADVTRIKWDTMECIKTKDNYFIKFLLPVSKTNQIGARIEYINLRQNKTSKFLCPVQMILKLKYWVGQPSKGFVFKCLAPNTKWVKDDINTDWSSYRCNGHWNSEEKHTCLGQTSSTHSFGYVHRFAKRLKWKKLPTKHSFRRTCLIIAKQLKISRAQINEGFGWVPHSDMIRHYTADHESTTLNAPAVAIATEFDKNHPFHCVNNVKFTCI